MPNYILHIGPSKTGTTYIQGMLFQSRRRLLEHGICYPDVWWTNPASIEHNPLTELLRTGRFAQVQEGFRSIEAQGHRLVVISSEDLESLTHEQLARLREAMGNNPVDVVYYCRRWSERIPSRWRQDVKNGLYATLPESYLATVRYARFNASVNYSLLWETMSQLFGRQHLHLVSYNNLRDRRIDIFDHFARTFLDWQVENSGLVDLSHENLSPDAIDTELVRALNWIDCQAKGPRRPNLNRRFSELRGQLDTREIEQIMAASMGEFEISDEADDFHLSWQEMNQFIDRLMPLGHTPEPLFERGTATIRYVRGDYLLRDGAARALQRLHRQIERNYLARAV